MRFASSRYFIQKSAEHAPRGGVDVGGTKYRGGEFIPADVVANATEEEKSAISGEATKESSESENPEGSKPVREKRKEWHERQQRTKQRESRKNAATEAAEAVMSNPVDESALREAHRQTYMRLNNDFPEVLNQAKQSLESHFDSVIEKFRTAGATDKDLAALTKAIEANKKKIGKATEKYSAVSEKIQSLNDEVKKTQDDLEKDLPFPEEPEPWEDIEDPEEPDEPDEVYAGQYDDDDEEDQAKFREDFAKYQEDMKEYRVKMKEHTEAVKAVAKQNKEGQKDYDKRYSAWDRETEKINGKREKKLDAINDKIAVQEDVLNDVFYDEIAPAIQNTIDDVWDKASDVESEIHTRIDEEEGNDAEEEEYDEEEELEPEEEPEPEEEEPEEELEEEEEELDEPEEDEDDNDNDESPTAQSRLKSLRSRRIKPEFTRSRFWFLKSFHADLILKLLNEIRTDKMGRRIKYVDGKRVKLGEGQAKETHDHIVGLNAAGNPREHLEKLAEHLSKHNVSELKALRDKLGVKATGKKADLAKKIAELALQHKEQVKVEKVEEVEKPKEEEPAKEVEQAKVEPTETAIHTVTEDAKPEVDSTPSVSPEISPQTDDPKEGDRKDGLVLRDGRWRKEGEEQGEDDKTTGQSDSPSSPDSRPLNVREALERAKSNAGERPDPSQVVNPELADEHWRNNLARELVFAAQDESVPLSTFADELRAIGATPMDEETGKVTGYHHLNHHSDDETLEGGDPVQVVEPRWKMETSQGVSYLGKNKVERRTGQSDVPPPPPIAPPSTAKPTRVPLNPNASNPVYVTADLEFPAVGEGSKTITTDDGHKITTWSGEQGRRYVRVVSGSGRYPPGTSVSEPNSNGGRFERVMSDRTPGDGSTLTTARDRESTPPDERKEVTGQSDAPTSQPKPPHPSTPETKPSTIPIKQVETKFGTRHVHTYTPTKTFWDARKAGKLPKGPDGKDITSVSKNPQTDQWEVSIWGKTPEEVAEKHGQLRKLGVAPERRMESPSSSVATSTTTSPSDSKNSSPTGVDASPTGDKIPSDSKQGAESKVQEGKKVEAKILSHDVEGKGAKVGDRVVVAGKLHEVVSVGGSRYYSAQAIEDEGHYEKSPGHYTSVKVRPVSDADRKSSDPKTPIDLAREDRERLTEFLKNGPVVRILDSHPEQYLGDGDYRPASKVEGHDGEYYRTSDNSGGNTYYRKRSDGKFEELGKRPTVKLETKPEPKVQPKSEPKPEPKVEPSPSVKPHTVVIDFFKDPAGLSDQQVKQADDLLDSIESHWQLDAIAKETGLMNDNFPKTLLAKRATILRGLRKRVSESGFSIGDK